jgi:hypothetical protein
MLLTKFVRVLRVELEDLEADIELVVEENYRRLQAHTETERVCRENVATLRNEEFGIRHFVEILDELDVDDYDNLDHLIATIRSRFHDVIERCGLARATIRFADRKIAKVKHYVTEFRDAEYGLPLQEA